MRFFAFAALLGKNALFGESSGKFLKFAVG